MELLFLEDGYVVKTLWTPEEIEASQQLRHETFSKELRWVPTSGDGLEKDRYDSFSDFIGVFDLEENLVGHLRFTPAPYPFMLEKEFSCLLSKDSDFRKTSDSAEITRLCVKKEYRSSQAALVSRLLYKGGYHLSMLRGVRYLLMVVDDRCFRHLRISGLPIEQAGDFIRMPDGVNAAACRLDWAMLAEYHNGKKAAFREWMTNIPTIPAHYPSLSQSHGLYLQR